MSRVTRGLIPEYDSAIKAGLDGVTDQNTESHVKLRGVKTRVGEDPKRDKALGEGYKKLRGELALS